MNCYDVIIVGGGLAGLTAAIDLSQKSYSILVIEKKKYPHHKVCGEYVSNEVLPYMNSLGVSFAGIQTKSIKTLLLSSSKGKSVQTELPLGGLGISRFAFDHLLYKRALEMGVDFRFDRALAIDYQEDVFEVRTEKDEKFSGHLVIGAYGKRSVLDKNLKRAFIYNKSSWLGVKAHYKNDDFPDDLVALHNFNGGYGGLSKTETGAINFCYLASYKSFQKEKSIENFNTNVIAQNPFLREFLQKSKPIFKEPLTIAQVSFYRKTAVEDHILMCGDTAGLIHPLCGNGMAMAIKSAQIFSEIFLEAFQTNDFERDKLEEKYRNKWESEFGERLKTGRLIQRILLNPYASKIGFTMARALPSLVPKIIKKTHGTKSL